MRKDREYLLGVKRMSAEECKRALGNTYLTAQLDLVDLWLPWHPSRQMDRYSLQGVKLRSARGVNVH